MLKVYLWVRNLLEGEQGQSLTEYALILVLIAIAAIAIMTTLGTQIATTFTTVKDALIPAGG